MSTSPLVSIQKLEKHYQSLRPLRVLALTVSDGDIVSISGMDAAAAETFVHLLTGATLPDAGEVTLFGHNTRAITDSAAWLEMLDGAGMISARGILIEAFTVLQNIAMSFTLDVDPIDARVVPQAGALAREVGIPADTFDVPAGRVGPEIKMRVHLARALALGPRLLVAEHPSATLPRESVAPFGNDLATAARSRGVALVALTADEVLARAIGGRRLDLVAATGELKPPGLLKRVFGS